MKYFLLLYLACSIQLAQTTDVTPADWSGAQYFDEEDYRKNGWAYGKKPPVVPEPSTYGAIMLGGVIAYCIFKRKVHKK